MFFVLGLKLFLVYKLGGFFTPNTTIEGFLSVYNIVNCPKLKKKIGISQLSFEFPFTLNDFTSTYSKVRTTLKRFKVSFFWIRRFQNGQFVVSNSVDLVAKKKLPLFFFMISSFSLIVYYEGFCSH